ncbi:MAG: RagB/SusD family nutrient uptake outer membrane protein, partial [Clostridia bacterium]|nr:RagB/SusD family nutrient uptake outer membrane protein [Clostridia bacterium]
MKKIHMIKMTVWCCLTVLIGSSCSDWLDVKPKTEEEAEEMFSTQEGFKAALAGAYIALCQPELYGKELTFGMVGVLGQEWASNSNTLGTTSSAYSNFVRYRYGEVTTKPIVEAVWKNMYTTIANVNTLIQYTEEKKDVLLGDNYEIIRGEALALRAFIHFDLFRLYGECDYSDSVKTIPYVLNAKPVITPQSTTKEIVRLIVQDLDEALTLLESDPVFTGKDVTGVDNGYLVNRDFHLNYYAVQGLKARVYAYAGLMQEAYNAAKIVIDAQKDQGIFSWVNKNDITTTNAALRDRTFSTEQLFALNTTQLIENIKGYFKETLTPLTKRNVVYETGDYRGVFFETDNGVPEVFSKFWQMDNQTVSGAIVRPKRNRMPILRVSEMYYIAAEYLKTVDTEEALEMLNTVRRQRGLIDDLTDADPVQIQAEILKEYEREFLGE